MFHDAGSRRARAVDPGLAADLGSPEVSHSYEEVVMGPVHRFARAALAATAVALAISAPAAAHDMGVEVVASGLDNPRGLDLADGTLWVTEAGKGGTGPCVPGPEMTPVCFGLSGALTAIDLQSGAKDRVLSGLPSLANPDGSSATGPSDVSLGRKLWMTIGLGGPTATRDLLPPAGQGMGRLYRLGDLGLEAVADLHAFEVANNPDADQPGSDIESNPNSLDAKAKPVVVADAGGNDILAIRHGQISIVALLPFGTAEAPAMPGMPPPPPGTMLPVDPVPTSVVRGPDGSLYVGQLTGFPFVPGAASVFRIPPGGGTPEVVASGFTLITDLAIGDDGSLYVVEFSTQSLLAGPAPGALIKVAPDGTRSELAAGMLVTPTGIVLGRDAAYVSNYGAAPGKGQVLRVPLGH
jgi:hypothetical protein